jgi:hypothetical protein
VCAFNPVYGQGMTTAAGAATLLAETLDRVGPTSPALPRTFFRAQAGFLADAWSLATGADFRFPGTTGARPALIGVFNRYLDALFNAAADDADLRRLIGEVIHMLRRPTAFFAPSVLGRVARATLGRVLQPAAAAPVPALPAA